MYLSKVIIARAWSRDLYQLHQGLWHLFPNRPDAARDFLFHVEKRNTPEGCHVLLQSAQMPVSTAVATVIKTKQVEFQLQVGVPLYFRLRANPIKTILDNQKRLDSKGNIKRCVVYRIFPRSLRLAPPGCHGTRNSVGPHIPVN